MDVSKEFPQCQQSYEDCSGNYFCHPNYEALVSRMGEILISSHDDDYQGDSYYILRNQDGTRVGFLEFGWGSCSGCDWLESCDSYEDLQALFDSLESKIYWFDSVTDFKTWESTHDWGGEWSSGKDSVKEIREKISSMCLW